MTTIALVLDCEDPQRLAEFWAAALHYTVAGSAGAYVMLVPQETGPPNLLLQRVPEVKTAKNRMHLDIHIADIDTEAARLEALGARRLDTSSLTEHGTSWHRMTDPEGNEFCVCDSGTG